MYESITKYGFKLKLHGGEVLLQWKNQNHYQVLVPSNPCDAQQEENNARNNN